MLNRCGYEEIIIRVGQWVVNIDNYIFNNFFYYLLYIIDPNSLTTNCFIELLIFKGY